MTYIGFDTHGNNKQVATEKFIIANIPSGNSIKGKTTLIANRLVTCRENLYRTLSFVSLSNFMPA